MTHLDLALAGGTPVRTRPYPGSPCIGKEEHDAVQRVLHSGVLSGFIGTPGDHHLGGPEVRAVEEQWRTLGAYSEVVSVNSATAALHAGLTALDLPAGAEVIVPPLTMSATVAAVRMAGLVPRFADLDPELFTLSASTVEPAIGPRTAAVLPVHLFGQMAPMRALRDLAAQRGLVVLEDGAQAPGATQDGAWPGHGTAGVVFSLNQHKVVTCGEGGLLASDDPVVVERAQLVRNHGESVVHAHPRVDPEGLVGWNYRLTELCAAVATAQTPKLERLNATRRHLADRLRCAIADVDGLVAPVVMPSNTHVYFTFAVRFLAERWGCDRVAFVRALQAEGIPSNAGYVPPLYRLPMFGAHGAADRDAALFPTCERLAQAELVLLPVVGWPASEADIDGVAEAILKCWARRHDQLLAVS